MTYVARHGGGDPVLLLLHGLGATGEVWHGLLERGLPGEVLVPDLPGHGRSPRLARYSFGAMAVEVAAEIEPGRRVVVVGHSLGGVLGLVLASGWFGVRVSAVCGVGIKLRWSDAELAKAAELAARPEKVFGSRAEAVERWLKVSGLAGLMPADSPRVTAGVEEVDGGWRVRVDPRAFGVGAPDVPGLLAASRATTTILAAGEHDPMSPYEHMRAVTPEVEVLSCFGHNAHVESPSALWPLIDRLVADVDDHAGR